MFGLRNVGEHSGVLLRLGMNRFSMMRRGVACAAGWVCAAGVAGLWGCEREGVQAYSVPKEAPVTVPVAEAVPAVAAAAVDAAPSAESDVTWTAPATWEKVTSAQPMRVATYMTAAKVEVVVSAFAGDAGGVLANVNRWRGQMGVAPATDAELAGMLATSLEGATRVATLEVVGADGRVMLGAIVSPGDGQTWFVKATVAGAGAAALRPEFDAFAKSFRRGGQTAEPIAPPALDTSMSAGTVARHDDGEIAARLGKWSAPAHWATDAGGGGIAAASYQATNADGGARVTVTSLKGDGGGALSNINRWRVQLGLAAWESMPAQPFAGAPTDLGNGAVMVDLVNAAGGDRMIAAVVPAGASTWFFKARGTPAGVEPERAAFERMVRVVGLGEE